MPFLGGYVSSLEGTPPSFLSLFLFEELGILRKKKENWRYSPSRQQKHGRKQHSEALPKFHQNWLFVYISDSLKIA